MAGDANTMTINRDKNIGTKYVDGLQFKYNKYLNYSIPCLNKNHVNLSIYLYIFLNYFFKDQYTIYINL